MKRPIRPAYTRKMRELDEMTGGRLPRPELRRAAENSRYVEGELVLNADGVRILIEYSPLDPVTKELRREQFEASVANVQRNRDQ
ncbi:hypothetical protein GCM10027447_12840 [Glycomyces halotolerans]